MPWNKEFPNTHYVAIHAALLPTKPTGEVLCFGDWENPGFQPLAAPYTYCELYDVAAKSSEDLLSANVPVPDTNAFCAGQAFIADGRLLIAGGTVGWPDAHVGIHDKHYEGERACWIYYPRSKKWVRVQDLNTQPDSEVIGGGRWYPTLVTLGNGQVIAIAGHPDDSDYYFPGTNSNIARHNNNTPERYSVALDEWTLMSADATAPDGRTSDDYPRYHLMPDGLLFCDTSGKLGPKRLFDPIAGVWTGDNVNTDALPSFYDVGSKGTSVLLPLLPPLYKPRVLATNSGHQTAFRIDVDDNPVWETTSKRTGSQNVERQHGCATLLPTGQVLVSGGWHRNTDDDLSTARRKPELYTPGINWSTGEYSLQEKWETIADQSEYGRGYHSVAILLPDGRVWHAGSTSSLVGAEKRVDVFEPAYFGTDNRPIIDTAPTDIDYLFPFEVKTVTSASDVNRVALMRCGAVTHAFNPDQRYVGLAFDHTGAKTLRVTPPSNPNVAPPGNYMLWLIDQSGDPCELASFVRLAEHKLLISAEISTYSVPEIDALGLPAVFHDALNVVCDGFLPHEVSTPAYEIADLQGNPVPGMAATFGFPLYESGEQDKDIAQRIVYPVHITFSNKDAFEQMPAGEDFRRIKFTARMHQYSYVTTLDLSKNPNPRMRNGNPHWFSVDLRTFQIKQGETLDGITHLGLNGPGYEFIRILLTDYNNWQGADEENNHPFANLPTGFKGNPLAWYMLDADKVPVYNYAVARVRYRAPEGVDVTSMRVIFRLWTTGWTSLEFDTNRSYARVGAWGKAAPLLGLYGGEINTIPCFAEWRQPNMVAQSDEMNYRQSLKGEGSEVAFTYFGCWLDINEAVPRFPIEPVTGETGPFSGELMSIQELIRGPHQCLVAEIYTTDDPTPTYATPQSSDNLAQRNLMLDAVPNPGGFATRLAHHTFEIQPSRYPIELSSDPGLSPAERRRLHPDELCIHWGSLPRDSHVTLFAPQIDSDEVLAYAARRNGPANLSKAGAHTLRCRVTDFSCIPIPGGIDKNIASLLSVQLPPNVKKGQRFSLVLRQIDGRSHTVRGATQFDIEVKTAEEILPVLERNLSVMKHVALKIPQDNRWYPVFERYLEELSARVRGHGRDPETIAPDPTGNGLRPESDDQVGGCEEGDDLVRVCGKISEILYGCAGEFEAFVLDDCGRRHRFFSCEKAMEDTVCKAFKHRFNLSVYADAADRMKPLRIVIHC